MFDWLDVVVWTAVSLAFIAGALTLWLIVPKDTAAYRGNHDA